MFDKIKQFFTKSQPSGYFHFKEGSGGGWPLSNWQLDRKKAQAKEFGPVFTCIQILAQEIAKLPIKHYKKNPDGSRAEIMSSAPARLWREPNKYQSRSDFWVYMVNSLLFEGNGYAYADRNKRFEITSLYPIAPSNCYPHIEPETKDVFYRVGTNSNAEILPNDINKLIPARNVLHLRCYTPQHPLVGETPITAAAASADLGLSIEYNGAKFFRNMSRPSGVLRVPGKIGKEARARLRESWKENLKGENQGNIGVLSDGAEWQQLTMSAQDAEIVLQHKMTVEDVARVFRIPLYMLGDMEKTTFNNVETLRGVFYSGVLSFYLEHFEAALNILFNLPADQYIQFDFDQTLRTNFKELIEALAAGTTGGVFKINEARKKVHLPDVDGGNNVFIQQQMQTVKDRAENKPLQPTAEPKEPEPTEPEPMTEEEQKALNDMIQKAINNEFNK